MQYQFVVPQKEVLQKIVKVLKKEGLYSTLGVLKIFGKQPKHYGNISFPMEGYSLAMDFKLSHDLYLYNINYTHHFYLKYHTNMSPLLSLF